MQVTPGYTFTATEPVTHTKLNQLGVPTVTLEDEEVTPAMLSPEVSGALGVARPNYLRNGNFAKTMWARGTSPASCPTGAFTYRADYWACRPVLVTSSGLPIPGTVKYQLGGNGPTTSPLSLDTAQFTGDSLVEAVDLLQDVPAHLAYALREQVTITVWIYNNSGAAFTPSLRLDTPDAEDNFGAVTNRVNQAGTSCSNAAWTKQTWTVDLTATTNVANGLRVAVRIPSPALNSAAKSVLFAQAKLERGATATAFVVERDELAEDLGGAGDGGVPLNYFVNPTLAETTWLRPSLSLEADVETGGPLGWYARAAGATGTVFAPLATSIDGLPATAVQLTGAASVDAVDVGTRFERGAAQQVYGTVTVFFAIYNATGAEVTPLLRVDTCDAANSFGAVTNRLEQPLQACANGFWTEVSHTFGIDGLTNAANGFRLELRFPDGALDADTKSVRVAWPRMLAGAVLAADLEVVPAHTTESAFLTGLHRGLKLDSTGSGQQFTLSVEEAVLHDITGRAIRISIPSALTLDCDAGNGVLKLDTGTWTANTWYHVWLISNGNAHSALISASSTAPTLPTGYHYRARVGAVRAMTGPDLRPFVQRGDCVTQQNTPVANGVGPAVADTLETLDIASAVPPTAVECWGNFGATTTAAALMAIAANPNATGLQILNAGGNAVWATGPGGTTVGVRAPFRLAIDEPQTLFWTASTTTANKQIAITGYRLG